MDIGLIRKIMMIGITASLTLASTPSYATGESNSGLFSLFRKSKSASNETKDVKSALQLRGQQLNQMEDKSDALAQHANSFFELTREISAPARAAKEKEEAKKQKKIEEQKKKAEAKKNKNGQVQSMAPAPEVQIMVSTPSTPSTSTSSDSALLSHLDHISDQLRSRAGIFFKKSHSESQVTADSREGNAVTSDQDHRVQSVVQEKPSWARRAYNWVRNLFSRCFGSCVGQSQSRSAK